ncbi:MAG: hydantoinase B/oxoprolinase family protein, partial [Theionarchaea archaeon]|nr:hydantoinase B/oxoprolinase family protein [Theionarchaea archaeon]
EKGRKGKNVLTRDGNEIELPSKTTYELLRGDIIGIETPGGGGYGNFKERTEELRLKDKREQKMM